MKTPVWILITLLLGGRAWGMAGPPLVTDDPGTPGPNRWEINLALVTEVNTSATTLELPAIDANYGLGERIQLKYEFPYVVSDAAGAPWQTGFGQPIAGTKIRFLDRGEGQTQPGVGIAMSTYPQYAFNSPFAQNHAANAFSNFLLPIEIEEATGKWELNEEVGYRVVWGAEDEFLYGFALTFLLRDGIALLGELNGNETRTFSDGQSLINIGSVIELGERENLLISLGHGLHEFGDATTSLLGYFGIQFHL